MRLPDSARKRKSTVGKVPRIRCVGNVCLIGFQPSAVTHMLALPTSPLAMARYGGERTVLRDGMLWVTETPHSRRYLLLPPQLEAIATIDADIAVERAIAVLELRKHGAQPTIDGVFVLPEWRRQGLATALISHALSDYPGLMLDGKFTLEGAALFGYHRHPAMRLCA